MEYLVWKRYLQSKYLNLANFSIGAMVVWVAQMDLWSAKKSSCIHSLWMGCFEEDCEGFLVRGREKLRI